MTAFTWHRSTPADVSIGSNNADDWLAAINTAVNAADGDAGAFWEVVSYVSSSPKSLLLRRISGDPGRIVIFGEEGSSPHASATRQAPAAGSLCIGYSATSTANTVDGSWISGAPLSASDYIKAVKCWVDTATTWRFNYIEGPDQLWLCPSYSGGMVLAGAGSLIENLSGTGIPTVTGSSEYLATGWSITATGYYGLISADVTANQSQDVSYANTQVKIGTGTTHDIFRLFVIGVGSAHTKLADLANTKAWFLPIVMIYNTTLGDLNIAGKFTQVAYGPFAVRETTLIKTSTGLAHAHAHGYVTPSAGYAIWFVNEAV
jgi:hypothetical protein